MPKKNNSWDRLPCEAKGDASASPIYLSVGIALSWFEVLQWRAGWLFQIIVGSESQALSRAFGTLENVPPRSKMIREAAKVRFLNDKSRLDRVKNLMTQYEELSHRRNEIAHGTVSNYTHNNVHLGNYLHPGSHITGRNTGGGLGFGEGLGDYAYTAAQINHYTSEFRRVGGEIQDLIDELKKLQPS